MNLSLTANFIISNYKNLDDVVISSNVSFTKDVAMAITTTLDNNGLNDTVESYTQERLSLTIEDNWGNNTSPVTIKMLDIDMDSSGSFLNQSQAVGYTLMCLLIN